MWKTNLTLVGRYLRKAGGLGFEKPAVWMGVQESGGTEGAIKKGLEAVAAMLPVANEAEREVVPVSELVLGVKCGGSDGFSSISIFPT